MRSPLTAMAYSLELLQQDLRGTASDESMEDIRVARAGGARLMRMINDLLDISRLEAGHMPLRRARTDLVAMAEQAVAAVHNLAPGRRVEVRGNLSTEVDCDPQVVRRVLENIIGNGLKHTPGGGALEVEVTRRHHGVHVMVSDRGPGVPVEQQERIFEKFGQTCSHVCDRHHSSGLGLTFCKLAVEAHGGSIGVKDREGGGSTFWFTLPLEEGG